MSFKHYYLLLVLMCSAASAQYISTDETYTPLQLIENVLINSGCASVSNVTVSGGNFVTGENSWGYFNANGSSFPFAEGIILSTGKITDAQGPNNFVSDDGNGMSWDGDLDLNQALNITNSINATYLEFDFIPLGNQISFDYIFASEEYHGNATCTYSDGFAFLLKEVGNPTYQNLALIPNTTIPVKVTSVHPDIPGSCAAQNEQYFDAFNDTEYPTNFNGQTKVLTAKSAVIPGHQYHIKLVIADEGNYRYDSAIFLKGSSFELGVDLGPDRTFANQNAVCYNESLTLIGTSAGALSYQWNFNGTPIAGQNTATLNFNPPYLSSQNGTYSLKTIYSATCTTSSAIDLNFAPQLVTGQTSYSYCDADALQDGITTITLSDIIPTLFLNLPTSYQVSFYDSPTSTTPLSNSYLNTIPLHQPIYAKIDNNNCYTAIPVTITITVFTDTITDETICLCNNTPVTLAADSGYKSYLWNTGETTLSIQVTVPATYTVTIENADGCNKIKTFTVIGSEIATISNIIISDLIDNSSVEIVPSGNGNYDYSLDGVRYQDSPIFEHLSGIVYTAFVRDKNGCGIAEQEFNLLQIPKYFTPNNDGFNDYWNIKGINSVSPNANSIIYIFDRFGKLIKQISPTSLGWDSSFNGKQMPADDYWYYIQLKDGRSAKGHFTLKR
ncbi:choice-of-anchor L domain-containing protein [Flavobacterium paronense]|uniref:Choice-of-anchor L domain-containing protein n=1 Tax=Flavobacterium paronense TaxID=1392775 RepID=A0ABV5GB07_9FLAO|nr:choice-of-anchor L domain-containing protein [Flavobacterium paronense]MDN3676803.1 choice-of-anchor L domain-containing protein [Flavobacterium paronense]